MRFRAFFSLTRCYTHASRSISVLLRQMMYTRRSFRLYPPRNRSDLQPVRAEREVGGRWNCSFSECGGQTTRISHTSRCVISRIIVETWVRCAATQA